jgi:hypothetical protein
MESSTYKFGGREWRPIVVSTFEHDIFLMKQLKASGLGNCTPDKNETPEQFGVRILHAMLEHGAPAELFGALVVPKETADTDWTPDAAIETGRLIRKLTDEGEKREVQRLLVNMLVDFFSEGLRSLSASSTALATQAEPHQILESVAQNSA